LPEVAGDAAVQFDPHDQKAIAHALRELLVDEQLRERLVARGHQRAREFTWERTARLTLESYARVLAA
jgi:glycosyltransferase involved in cell wall biosynthesis